MKRSWLFMLLSILAGLSFGMLLGESGLRIYNYINPFMDRYRLELQTVMFSSHPFLNHSLTPNLTYDRPETEFGVPPYRVETNSLGFRFDLQKFKKKGDKFRIAVLGDSQIEGEDIKYTLPVLLEQKLVKLTGNKNIEVMNFGVMSYSPIIHYVNLKRQVLDFKPDLVLVHFDMTDVFDDNVRYKQITAWDKEMNPVSVNPGADYTTMNIDGRPVTTVELGRNIAMDNPFASTSSFLIYLMEKSYLFKIAYFKTHDEKTVFDLYDGEYLKDKTTDQQRYGKVDAARLYEWCTNYDAPGIRKQEEFSFSILGKLNNLMKTNGIPFIVITMPMKSQLVPVGGKTPDSTMPIVKLHEFCVANKIGFHCPDLKMLTVLLKNNQEIYWLDRAHFNYRGKELWADSLGNYVVSWVKTKVR